MHPNDHRNPLLLRQCWDSCQSGRAIQLADFGLQVGAPSRTQPLLPSTILPGNMGHRAAQRSFHLYMSAPFRKCRIAAADQRRPASESHRSGGPCSPARLIADSNKRYRRRDVPETAALWSPRREAELGRMSLCLLFYLREAQPNIRWLDFGRARSKEVSSPTAIQSTRKRASPKENDRPVQKSRPLLLRHPLPIPVPISAQQETPSAFSVRHGILLRFHFHALCMSLAVPCGPPCRSVSAAIFPSGHRMPAPHIQAVAPANSAANHRWMPPYCLPCQRVRYSTLRDVCCRANLLAQPLPLH